MTRTLDALASFTRGYAEATIWANTFGYTSADSEPAECEPHWWQTPSADWPIEAFDAAAQETIRSDCRDFVSANLRDLWAYARAYRPAGGWDVWACAGHDFALTRNGHGAGFWDRGLGELGERLTQASKPYGSANGWYDASDDATDTSVHLEGS